MGKIHCNKGIKHVHTGLFLVDPAVDGGFPIGVVEDQVVAVLLASR